MAVYGKKLLDNEGNTILPKTRASLVYTSDDSTVEDTLNGIKSGNIAVGNSNKLNGRETQYSGPYWYLKATGSDTSLNGALPYYASVCDNEGNQFQAAYARLSGATFSGAVGIWSNLTVYGTSDLQGTNIMNGATTFNAKMQVNNQCAMAQDKSPGNGVYAQPIHIPNIAQNIRYVILWT